MGCLAVRRRPGAVVQTVVAQDFGHAQPVVAKQAAPSLCLRAAMAGLDPARTTAFLCGPGGMMARAADCLEGCGLPPRAIHFERFRYDAQGLSRKDWRRMGAWVALFGSVAGAITLFALA